MSFARRLQELIRVETARRSNVLWIGMESALIGLILVLAILVLTSLLGLSDTIRNLCFPLLFAALVLFGALAGFNAQRRGVETSTQVAISGGICGLLMGLSLGVLTGILSVMMPFMTTVRLAAEATQTSADPGEFILPTLAFCSLTFVLTFLGTIVGALCAVLTRVILVRAGIDVKGEPPLERVPPASFVPHADSESAFLPPLEDVPEELRPAWHALKAGEHGTARSVIAKYLMSDLESETGWLLLAHVLDDPIKKRESLERILQLNPSHVTARRMLRNIMAPPPVEYERDFSPHAREQPPQMVDDMAALSDAELRKRSLWITGIGAAVTALIPLVLMVFDRYGLAESKQPAIVILLALVTAFILGLNLRRAESPNRYYAAAVGAISGVMVAAVAVFTFALAYHAVFLPMDRDHTRFQGILAWIADGIFGASFLGALFGACGALAAYYSAPLSRRIQARIRSAARNNAWAALWLAITSSGSDRRAYFLDQALALGPSNPAVRLVQRMHESSGSGLPALRADTGWASIMGRLRLPPLFTTEMGRKFLLRAGISIGLLLSCSVCGNLLGLGGDLLDAVTSFVGITLILLAGGLLVWFVVQGLRSGQDKA